MKWYLVVERGQHKGQVIPVPRESFLIGRAACCHLRPSAPSVSRRHCALMTRGRRLFVADCQASNGTFVNGRRLDQEQPLQPGDRLQVGPLAFVVTIDGPPVSPVRRELNDDTIGEMLLELDAKEKPRPKRVDSGPPPATTTDPRVSDLPQVAVASEEKESSSSAFSDRDTASAAEELLERMRKSGREVVFRRRDQAR